MEDLGDTIGAHDTGRYDNDFEKLPRDEEEVNSAAELLAGSGSPGGDAKTESATIGEEVAPAASKSQLNVDETSVMKPQPADSEVGGTEGGVCTTCESSRT